MVAGSKLRHAAMYEDFLILESRRKGNLMAKHKVTNSALPTRIKAASEPALDGGDAPARRLQSLLHETRNRRQAAQREELRRTAKPLEQGKQ